MENFYHNHFFLHFAKRFFIQFFLFTILLALNLKVLKAQSSYNSQQPIFLSHYFNDSILLLSDFATVADTYLDDVHVHLTPVGSYHRPNPYLISILGGSPAWTQYFYNGADISNPLRKGDALYHFSVSGRRISLDRHRSRFQINLQDSLPSQVMTTIERGNIGGPVFYNNWFLNNLSGHPSAEQRLLFPIRFRPHVQYHQDLLIDFKGTISRIEGYINRRTHIYQNFNGSNNEYSETSAQLSFATNTFSGWTALGEYQYRSHDLAEYQYSEEETRNMHRMNLTAYKRFNRSAYSLSIGMESTEKNAVFISRNILDQDGEGLEPYYPEGSQFFIGGNARHIIKKSPDASLSFHLSNRANFITHQPSNNVFNTLTYIPNGPVGTLPLNFTEWEALPFSTLLGYSKNYLSWNDTEEEEYSVVAEVGLSIPFMVLKSFSSLSFQPHLLLEASKQWKNWNIGFYGSWQAQSFDIQQAQYLSSDYLNGRVYYWNDFNRDERFTTNEKGTLFRTSGGRYRSAQNLSPAKVLHLEVPLTYGKVHSGQWSLVSQFRSFRDTWLTSHQDPSSIIGEELIQDGTLFRFLKSGESQYLVHPYPEGLHQNKNGEDVSWFFNQPFYAGATLRYHLNKKAWYFAASFTANMVVGASGMGNGPLHNHINTLSETTADPNLITNNVGRLDSDRSFISRWLYSRKIGTHTRIAIQLKYKDGQSFANYAYALKRDELNQQIAFAQREVRGDNPLTQERGRREDFLMNTDLRLEHALSWGNGHLITRIAIINVLDFGNETIEYTFGNINGYDRAPLELQSPRSIQIQLAYQWK